MTASSGVRASGEYATYKGAVHTVRSSDSDEVNLFAVDAVLPNGPVRYGNQYEDEYWAAPGFVVSSRDLDRLVEVATTCRWRGEPFEVWAVTDGEAYLGYQGAHPDEVRHWPGMNASGCGVEGRVPLSELADIVETVADIELPRD